MIKFEHTDVVGWEHAIRGMRNPMNSWEKSDSLFGKNLAIPYAQNNPTMYVDLNTGYEMYIGDNDYAVMKRLAKSGTDHRKFMRMITVYVDITAPLYWWKEFDTYKVGTVANSCSTMHKIHEKEFALDDFSCEHLVSGCIQSIGDDYNDFVIHPGGVECLENTVAVLNRFRTKYLDTKDNKYWWQMIQLLPSSYNQKRTIELNYEVLANIYKSRKYHKLDEWRIGFMDWIKSLPCSKLITVESEDK